MAYQDGDSRTYGGGVAYVRQNGLWYPQPDPVLAAAQGGDGGGTPDDASQGYASDMSALFGADQAGLTKDQFEANVAGKVDPDRLTDQIALTKDAFVNATDPAGKVNALWQLGSLIMAASQQPQQADGSGGGGANGNPPQPAQPAQSQQNAPEGPDDGGSSAPQRPLPPPLLGQSQGPGGGSDGGSGIPLLPPDQQNPPPFAADLPGAPGGSDQQPSILSLLSSGQQMPPQGPGGGNGPPQQLLPPSFWDQPQGPGTPGSQQPSGVSLPPPDQQNPPPFVADLPGAPGGSDGSPQPSSLSLLSSDQQMPPPFVAGLAGAPGGVASALQQLGVPGGMAGGFQQFGAFSPSQAQPNAPQGSDQQNPPPFVTSFPGVSNGPGAVLRQLGAVPGAPGSGGRAPQQRGSLFYPPAPASAPNNAQHQRGLFHAPQPPAHARPAGPSGYRNHVLTLSRQDIDDMQKTTATETDGRNPDQLKGIVDTMLNRLASGRWGHTMAQVVNFPAAFSNVNGRVANRRGRNSVSQLPHNRRIDAAVNRYLAERAQGTSSIVGDNLNYANPYGSDPRNLPWIYRLNGPVLGHGRSIHRHGTTPDLQRYRPGAFTVVLPDQSQQ